MDAYEHVDGDAVVVAGGSVIGVVSTGFAFTDTAGQQLRGPLTAVLAVDTTPPTPPVSTSDPLDVGRGVTPS